MKYNLTFDRPAEQLITVSIEADLPAGSSTFWLPHWRPGRYELQHYARCLADMAASGPDGEPLALTQTGTHRWVVDLPAAATVHLRYVFYAQQPDAGGSWFDHQQIYVNPINLLLFRPETLDQPCTLQLHLPAGFQAGGGLPGSGPVYSFVDFHQLVDTPFFAAPDLIHHAFAVAGVPTHLWFLGRCQPDLSRIEADIRAYTEAQIQLFGSFPAADFHYLYLMLPHRYRHGVEHQNSTVIALGPGYRLMDQALYRSFLEISSHELFHAWNVKALRPADMWPYDYRQENYSRLHYITEGITTYYGDLMLWKAGLWTFDDWVDSINGELQRHYQTGAQAFTSLEEASFRSWTNGYAQEGIPNRRISFYTKGYLVALLLDLRLRQLTDHQVSLDRVMATFYHRITTAGRGYTRADFQGLIEELSGQDFGDFFARYVEGTDPLEPALQAAAAFTGLVVAQVPPTSPAWAHWGLRTGSGPRGSLTVEHLLPGSPLLAAGLSQGDELIALDGQQLSDDLDHRLTWQRPQEGEAYTLHYFHQGQLRETRIPAQPAYACLIPQMVALAQPTAAQAQNRRAWQAIQPFVPAVQPLTDR